MLAVEAAGIGKGQTVLDLCAAPGGKSLHAASKLADTGSVLSFDITEAKLLRTAFRRISFCSAVISARDCSVA